MVDIESSEAPENLNGNGEKININTMEIKLDDNNPRLNLKADASQNDIRQSLFEQEDIMGLIDSIVENGGLFPGENIIVLKTVNYYKVLEGNRRVCSLQCMIDPELAPSEYRDTIKNLLKDFDITNIKTLEVYVAPSRDSAQKIITSRHTKYQIRKWSYISKWRRDYKEFLRMGDVQKVSDIFGEDSNQVIKNLREYAFIRYILDMPIWTSEELNQLSSNDLKGSLLEREMSIDIQNILGITIDSKNYDLHTSMEKEKFDYVLSKFTRSLFLGGEPNISTRTNKEDVKEYVNKWITEYDDSHVNTIKEKNSVGTIKQEGTTDTEKKEGYGDDQLKTKSKGKTPKAHSGYFRNLKVGPNLKDESLEHVVYEISKIQVEKFPLATLLLTRTLIEKALIYRLRHKNIWGDFMKKMETKYGEHNYTLAFKLDDLLTYCIDFSDKLFDDPKFAVDAKKALEAIKSNSIRQFLNDMVHESLRQGSPASVDTIADNIKGVIQKILYNEP